MAVRRGRRSPSASSKPSQFRRRSGRASGSGNSGFVPRRSSGAGLTVRPWRMTSRRHPNRPIPSPISSPAICVRSDISARSRSPRPRVRRHSDCSMRGTAAIGVMVDPGRDRWQRRRGIICWRGDVPHFARRSRRGVGFLSPTSLADRQSPRPERRRLMASFSQYDWGAAIGWHRWPH